MKLGSLSNQQILSQPFSEFSHIFRIYLQWKLYTTWCGADELRLCYLAHVPQILQKRLLNCVELLCCVMQLLEPFILEKANKQWGSYQEPVRNWMKNMLFLQNSTFDIIIAAKTLESYGTLKWTSYSRQFTRKLLDVFSREKRSTR